MSYFQTKHNVFTVGSVLVT